MEGAGTPTARTAAHSLAGIGLGSGFLTLVTTCLPRPPGFQTEAVRLVGLVTMAISLLVLLVPWRRLPLRATLALVPVGLALITWHNHAGGTDPFRYGIFYLALFVWVGVFHRRGVSLCCSPLVLVSYLTPMLLDDSPAYVLATASYAVPLYVGIGEVLAWRSSELARTQRHLRHLAEHDSLTGLANRSVFLRELDHLTGSARPAVIYVDLDDFKRVNDLLGHSAGDQLLRRAAEAMTAVVRPGDLVARLGGDEFAVLLPHVVPGDEATVRAIADRLVDALRAIDAGDGTGLSGSVGLAVGDDVTAAALVTRADLAMYQAKRGGKDAVVLAADTA